MNQQALNKYFQTTWHSRIDQYRYSGYALIDKINPAETVIDVGCGINPFKNKIKNLIGIDPAFKQADYQILIEDFITDQKFDVAFCLGSINFGSEARILKQISSVVELLKLKSRIYWRCNPGLADHNNTECQYIDFFPWTLQNHLDYAEQFGFICEVVCWDNNNRIYAEWIRSA